MTAETITVKDLTERIGKPAGEILKKLFLLGIMANINSELDFDTTSLVCSEFGVELEMKLAHTAEDALDEENFEELNEKLIKYEEITDRIEVTIEKRDDVADALSEFDKYVCEQTLSEKITLVESLEGADEVEWADDNMLRISIKVLSL